MNSETFIKKLSVLLKNTENMLEVVDYTDKSIVVFGKSTGVKEDLKSMGGKYNPKLKKNDETTAGWIFPVSKKELVVKFVDKINTNGGIIHPDDIIKNIEKLFIEKSNI